MDILYLLKKMFYSLLIVSSKTKGCSMGFEDFNRAKPLLNPYFSKIKNFIGIYGGFRQEDNRFPF
jgi:hypothetical protein